MRKSLVAATLAAVLGMSGGAYAADLTGGSMKDSPLYAPVNTWAGFYIGTNAGGVWTANKGTLGTDAFDHPWNVNSNASTLSPSGDFGGAEFGYNVQRGNIVFGLEGDIQYANVHDRNATGAQQWDSVAAAIGESNLDWFGTLRARLGYSFGRTLVYATGGFAFGGVRDGLQVTSVDGKGHWSPDTEGASSSGTATGYTVGGGFEYALSPDWSVKTEYQYINLGSTTLYQTAYVGGDDAADATLKVNHDYHTVRMGLNYHLGATYEPLK